MSFSVAGFINLGKSKSRKVSLAVAVAVEAVASAVAVPVAVVAVAVAVAGGGGCKCSSASCCGSGSAFGGCISSRRSSEQMTTSTLIKPSSLFQLLHNYSTYQPVQRLKFVSRTKGNGKNGVEVEKEEKEKMKIHCKVHIFHKP